MSQDDDPRAADDGAAVLGALDPDALDPLALPDYAPGAGVALTDAERWPGLSAQGRARLDGVLRHPSAPVWTHRAGHRLDADAIARARTPLPVEGWLDEHLRRAAALPAYRGLPVHRSTAPRLEDFPVVDRDDLQADIAAFVPLDADLSRLVEGTSSGSTGHALLIPDDVEDVARTFWMLHALVEQLGIAWAPDARRLAVASVVLQRQAYTYASAVPGFGDAVMARISLDATAWPGRDAFLTDADPQVISGPPAALEALLDPGLAGLRPLAIVSAATHLSPSLRLALQTRFGCPVLDVYGLHETRPLAVSADGGPHRVLPRVVVEVLDADGAPTDGHGEIVVTAGANPLLPLVRYATGDHGRVVDGAIVGLEGRDDVRFVRPDGVLVPAVDLTQQLQDAGVRGWTVAQDAAGAVTATLAGGDPDLAARRLEALLGRAVHVVAVARIADLGPGKPRRYRSDAATTRPASA